MVEVFKTNVQQVEEANLLFQKLAEHFPHHKINFDLTDCDKILRLEGDSFFPQSIIDLLNENGVECEVLS
jgi:hypothetical protein